MAKKNNRKCLCCSTAYRYCDTCSEDKGKPAWMASFHDENCKKIFMAATDYFAGDLDKVKAKQIVTSANLSNQANFKDSIKKFIKEVTSDAPIQEKKIEVAKKEEALKTEVKSPVKTEDIAKNIKNVIKKDK